MLVGGDWRAGWNWQEGGVGCGEGGGPRSVGSDGTAPATVPPRVPGPPEPELVPSAIVMFEPEPAGSVQRAAEECLCRRGPVLSARPCRRRRPRPARCGIDA